MTGGPYVVLNTVGPKNDILQYVIVLTGHPIEDILGVIIDDEYIDISGPGGTTNDSGNSLDANYFLRDTKYGYDRTDPDQDPNNALARIIKVLGWGYADNQYVTDYLGNQDVLDDRARAKLLQDEVALAGGRAGRLKEWVVPTIGSGDRDPVTGLYPAGHKLTNCAHIYLHFKFDTDVWAGFPTVKFHIKGKRLYDPSLDANLVSDGADSAGTHDITDPDTFEWSANWGLCVLDYLLNKSYGLAARWEASEILKEVNWAAAIEATIDSAEIVDTGLSSPNNLAPRYTTNGIFEVSSTPISITEALLTSGAGNIIYAQGEYNIRAGVYKQPNLDTDIINEDMIVSAIQIRTHTTRSEIFNKAAGVFVSKGYDDTAPILSSTSSRKAINVPSFEPSDFIIVDPTDSTGLNPFEVADEEEIIRDFDYPYTINDFEAQRLARIQLERVRRGISISFEANLKVLKFSVGDTVYLEILSNSKYANEVFFNRLGFDDTVQNRPDSPFTAYYKQFKIIDMQYTENFTIAVSMIEEAEEIYDWNDGDASINESEIVSNIPGVSPTALILPPTWLVASPNINIAEDIATGSGTTVTTILKWDASERSSPDAESIDGSLMATYRVEYGQVSDTSNSDPALRVAEWIHGGTIISKPNDLSQGPLALETLFKDGILYDFRVRGVAYTGRASAWAYFSVETGGDYDPTAAPVADAITAFIEPENGVAWVRAINSGAWTPSQASTDLDVTFRQGGLDVARTAARVTLNTTDGTLTSATITHKDGNLNASRVTISDSFVSPGTTTITVTFDYLLSPDISSISETVTSSQSGNSGTDGISVWLTDTHGSVVTTDTTGSNYTLPVGVISNFKIFDGSIDVTDTTAVTYSIIGAQPQNNLTLAVNDSIGNKGDISISDNSPGWNTDDEHFTVRANYLGIDYDQNYGFRKIRKGSPGRVIYASKETETIDALADGTGYTLPINPVSQITFFDDNVNITDTSAVTYVIDSPDTKNGLTISISDSIGSKGEVSLSGASPSWTTAYETFTIRVTFDNTDYFKEYSISKALGGIQGDPGTGGADGIVGWGHDLVFSSTDSDTVAWTSGTITTAAGSTFPIDSPGGNTGNMASGGRTYIYFDGNSPVPTSLTTTTTAATAVGEDKILIAVAEPTGDSEAFFQVFGGYGGLLITGNEVVANSITANEINASFYTGRTFTGGTFQTRIPNSSSPFPGTSRAVIQEADPQIAVYSNDGSSGDVEIFGVTDIGGGLVEISIIGDFVSGSLNTAQMYSSAGITDLRGRLGVIQPSSPTGGITTLTSIPQSLNIFQTDYELDIDIYDTNLTLNTLTFTINDSVYLEDNSPTGFTAPSWDLDFFYSTGSPHSWTAVPGGNFTVTGNVFDFEIFPGTWNHTMNLNATRQVEWTPASPFAQTDPIFYMIRVEKIVGTSDNPNLTACNGSEAVSGGSVQTFNDLTDVDLTGAIDNDMLVRSGGNWIATVGDLTWDPATLRLSIGANLTIEDDGGTPGTSGITMFKNGIGADIMHFADTDGGVVVIDEATFRLSNGVLFEIYGVSTARARLSVNVSNYMLFDQDGSTLTDFRFAEPIGILSAGAPPSAPSAGTYSLLYGIVTAPTSSTFLAARNTQGFSNPIENVNDIVWRFSSATTSGDPTSPFMRFNNVSMASVTAAFFNDNTYMLDDGGYWLAELAAGDVITVRQPHDRNRWARFSVDSPAVDNTGHWEVALTFVDGGTVPTNGTAVHFTVEHLSAAGVGIDWTADQGGDNIHPNNLSDGAQFADSIVNRAHLSDFAIEHQAVAAIATTVIGYDAGQSILLTMGAFNISTMTINNWPATGRLGQLQFEIAQGSTPRTITWPAAVTWIGGAAPDISTANETYLILLSTRDAAGSIIGSFAADASSGVASVFGRSGVVVAVAGDYAAIAETYTAAQTFNDNVELRFGTGNDVQQDFDGTDLVTSFGAGMNWNISGFTAGGGIVLGGSLIIESGAPFTALIETGVSANSGNWSTFANAEEWQFGPATDAGFVTAMILCTRSAGLPLLTNLLSDVQIEGDLNMVDNDIRRARFDDFSIVHQVVTGVASTTINYSSGQSVLLNLSATNITTLTLSNWPASGNLGQIEIEVTQGATPRTIAWDTALTGTVDWPEGTEPNLNVANGVFLVSLRSRDNLTGLIGTYTEALS